MQLYHTKARRATGKMKKHRTFLDAVLFIARA